MHNRERAYNRDPQVATWATSEQLSTSLASLITNQAVQFTMNGFAKGTRNASRNMHHTILQTQIKLARDHLISKQLEKQLGFAT